MDPFAYARKEHESRSRDWTGWCAVFTRTAFGAPAIGDHDGDGAADAEDVWKAAKHKHPETNPARIPRGVPVFWSGGAGDHGHAAVSAGNALMWSTDVKRTGYVDLVPIDDVRRKWGLTLLGWTEDINGVRVYTPPTKEEPTMALSDYEKRTLASLTRLEAVLSAVARALGFGKQLDAALAAAEKNNRDKGVIK